MTLNDDEILECRRLHLGGQFQANSNYWQTNEAVTCARLCEQLSPFITKQGTQFRNSVSAEKRLAVTLYRLAGNECVHTLSNVFTVGLSTACAIANKVSPTSY